MALAAPIITNEEICDRAGEGAHTDPSYDKHRIPKLGRKLAPETIEKIRQTHLGKQLSDEHKAKIGQGLPESIDVLMVDRLDFSPAEL
jgi:hypothetical protein